MQILEAIRDSWGWTGLAPAEVLATNAFGNVILRAEDGRIWRICPEALSCEVISQTPEEFLALRDDEEFRIDWAMARLVELAMSALGPVPADRCYCLKVPASLGGAYDPSNFGTISRFELIGVSGHIAEQIKDLPDGTRIELRIE